MGVAIDSVHIASIQFRQAWVREYVVVHAGPSGGALAVSTHSDSCDRPQRHYLSKCVSSEGVYAFGTLQHAVVTGEVAVFGIARHLLACSFVQGKGIAGLTLPNIPILIAHSQRNVSRLCSWHQEHMRVPMPTEAQTAVPLSQCHQQQLLVVHIRQINVRRHQ